MLDPLYEARPEDESEASLAALLAHVLSDDDWWAAFDACPDDERWRATLAARAIELYRRTAPVLESALGHAALEPVHRAAGVLREIADACAMLSHRWMPDMRTRLGIPTRPVIELLIRLDDVDDWAGSHGCALGIEQSGIPEEAWPNGPDESERDLALLFSQITGLHEMVLRLRGTAEGRDFWDSDEYRDCPCVLISGARYFLRWTRGHLESHAEPVAFAVVLLAQAHFVAAREQASDDALFPSEDFLRALLHDTGGAEWLHEQGVQLPAWLV